MIEQNRKNNKTVISSGKNKPSVKRHFELVVNKVCDSNLQTQETLKTNTNDQPSSKLSEDRFASNDHLDIVRSGESLIKHFSFDTSKYNSDTDKYVEFWNMLKKADIRPIARSLIKCGDNENKVRKENKRKGVDTEEQPGDSQSVIHRQTINMWFKALKALQRKKMDEVAFAATRTNCRLCKQEEPYTEFKKKQLRKISVKELKDMDDIICLNNWNPPPRTTSTATSKMFPTSIIEDIPQTSLQQSEMAEKPQSSTEIDNVVLVQQPEAVEKLQSSSQLDNLVSKNIGTSVQKILIKEKDEKERYQILCECWVQTKKDPKVALKLESE